jgi:hypothetical protein
VLSGLAGAVSGFELSIDGNDRLLFLTRDASGFEDANYRQLDSRMFQYVFSRMP